ncbi:MAG: VWA domain-containing protein [Anaerolineae bacterium]|nr:VWA domain-containing protein [Anaerolineae bacterium]
MRKAIVALLLACLLLNALSGVVLADGMILPGLSGGGYLVVRYHHVTVNIVDNGGGVVRAVTRVEQEFYNPYDFDVAGRYLFPVPPEAMIANFKVTLAGTLQPVTRQDAATTNRQLYDLVAQNHDPSLLQYADWETLAFEVTLRPGESRPMALEYEEVLAPSGDMFRYRYILGTERYTARPLEDVSVTVDLASDHSLGVLYSPSHAITTERAQGRAKATWTAQNVQPYENFDLYFSFADGGFGSGLLTGAYEDADGVLQDHFLFLFAPENSTYDDALPKDIVFVVDRSGSMSGEKIEQAQSALKYILGRLNDQDRFSIVAFDDQILSFSPTLRVADSTAIREASRFVDELYANTNTDIEGALQTGLGILSGSESRPGATRLVVFLTDGLPTAGVTDAALIADLIGRANSDMQARLHVFGVGYDVNTHLLDRLSSENGGSVTYVQPGENLEAVLAAFYGKIASPVLTDVEIEFGGIEVADVYPRALPDMFRGSSLLLSGRYRATQPSVTVTVRGMAGTEAREFRYTFALDGTGRQDFVPRLWATRRIGDLLDKVRVEGESAALIEEIRALGLAYGLVTPYTTSIIAAQAAGAASSSNMALYQDQGRLNQSSGQVTIQARVQNQMYQDAAQSNLANGSNVINSGQQNLVQLQTSNQNVDLRLLQGYGDLSEPISDEWIAKNIQVDRKISFGSREYFALAEDAGAREYLQSGSNVIFKYKGTVIQVLDETPSQNSTPATSNNMQPLPDAGNERAGSTPSFIQTIALLLQAAWEAITH